MKKILPFIFIVFIFMVACENDYPEDIYNPDYDSKPTPVIADIDPDTSYSGIGVVTITGQNFSDNPEEVKVYFNGNKAKMLSASATQLQVQVPTLVADSIRIQVYVVGAYSFGEYPQDWDTDPKFILQDALVTFKAMDNNLDISGLAVDTQERIYTDLATREVLRMAHPDCTSFEVFGNSRLTSVDGIKVGPGGYVYMTKKRKNIYRLPPDSDPTTNADIWAKVEENVYDLDFDQNGNIFLGSTDGFIFRVKSDGDTTGSKVAFYEDYEILLNRVAIDPADGKTYLYSYLEYDGSDDDSRQDGIWRNEILNADGELGPNQLIFDWYAYGGTTAPEITGLIFDQYGKLYVSQNVPRELADETYAVVSIEWDTPGSGTGTVSPLYDEILNAPIINMVWGNSNYLYLFHYLPATESEPDPVRRLYRLSMPFNSAPYYGRQ